MFSLSGQRPNPPVSPQLQTLPIPPHLRDGRPLAFRRVCLRHSARAPLYPNPRRNPCASCAQGCRWPLCMAPLCLIPVHPGFSYSALARLGVALTRGSSSECCGSELVCVKFRPKRPRMSPQSEIISDKETSTPGEKCDSEDPFVKMGSC